MQEKNISRTYASLKLQIFLNRNPSKGEVETVFWKKDEAFQNIFLLLLLLIKNPIRQQKITKEPEHSHYCILSCIYCTWSMSCISYAADLFFLLTISNFSDLSRCIHFYHNACVNSFKNFFSSCSLIFVLNLFNLVRTCCYQRWALPTEFSI